MISLSFVPWNSFWQDIVNRVCVCVMWNSAKKNLSHGQGHGTPTLYSPLSSFVTHYFLRSQIFLLEWTEGFFCLCCDESLMKKLPGWHICFHKCWMKETKDFLESLSSPARRSKIQESSGCPPDNFLPIFLHFQSTLD